MWTGPRESTSHQMPTNHRITSWQFDIFHWNFDKLNYPLANMGQVGKSQLKKHHGKNHRTLVVILHLDHVGAPKGQRLENFPMPSFPTMITIVIVTSLLLILSSAESACNIRSIDTWTVSWIQPGMSHDTPGKGRIFFPKMIPKTTRMVAVTNKGLYGFPTKNEIILVVTVTCKGWFTKHKKRFTHFRAGEMVDDNLIAIFGACNPVTPITCHKWHQVLRRCGGS